MMNSMNGSGLCFAEFMNKDRININRKKTIVRVHSLLCLFRDEGWCIISYEETFPRVVDIDMAVERHLARKFVDANSYILMQYASTQKNQPIPQLFSTEYIIGDVLLFEILPSMISYEKFYNHFSIRHELRDRRLRRSLFREDN